MKVIQAAYREENGRTVVSLRFKSRDQLLDPEDPSPLAQKELTCDAENSIINNLFSLKLRRPVHLEIQIPGVPDPATAAEISDAIRHHFRFVLAEHIRDTAIFIRERRISLAFTAVNLLMGILYLVLFYDNESWINSIAGTITGGIIIILNWATIWDTYEFFIFDTRNRMHRKNLLNKIIDTEITVIPFQQFSA